MIIDKFNQFFSKAYNDNKPSAFFKKNGFIIRSNIIWDYLMLIEF
jgi:hypothetical protein